MKKLLDFLLALVLFVNTTVYTLSCSFSTKFIGEKNPTPDPEPDPNPEPEPEPEINYISIEEIKLATSEIQNLQNIDQVNVQLQAISIEGVSELVATVLQTSDTDVLINISLEENWAITENVYEYILEGALELEIPRIEIKKQDVIDATAWIVRKENLEVVQENLETTIKMQDWEDTLVLTGTVDPSNALNVIVNITLKEGYKLDSESTEFIIEHAIKDNYPINPEDVIEEIDKLNIKDFPSLTSVQEALDTITVKGVKKLVPKFLAQNNNSDIYIVIVPDDDSIVDGENTYHINGALKYVFDDNYQGTLDFALQIVKDTQVDLTYRVDNNEISYHITNNIALHLGAFNLSPSYEVPLPAPESLNQIVFKTKNYSSITKLVHLEYFTPYVVDEETGELAFIDELITKDIPFEIPTI